MLLAASCASCPINTRCTLWRAGDAVLLVEEEPVLADRTPACLERRLAPLRELLDALALVVCQERRVVARDAC